LERQYQPSSTLRLLFCGSLNFPLMFSFAPDFFAAFFDAFVAVFLAFFFFVDFFADFLGATAFATVFFGKPGTVVASVASGM
jgi:hypothetical protein